MTPILRTDLPAPIVIVNTAHSGSRPLTQILQDAGVFMGHSLGSSMDAVTIMPLLERVLMSARGPFGMAEQAQDQALREAARRTFTEFTAGLPPGAPWGWKLCETLLILPFIVTLFPEARVVHLVRDGRDVALSPFRRAESAVWRKVYFGSAEVEQWRGFGMTQRAYRLHGPLFNAARWRHHVNLAAAFGAMMGPHYVEVRFEDIVGRYKETVCMLARALDLPGLAGTPAPALNRAVVGRWRDLPSRRIAELLGVLEPTLSAFGYADCAITPRFRAANALDWLLTRSYALPSNRRSQTRLL